MEGFQHTKWCICVPMLVQLISHWCMHQSNVLRTKSTSNIPMAFYFKHILCIVNSLRSFFFFHKETDEEEKSERPFSMYHLFYYVNFHAPFPIDGVFFLLTLQAKHRLHTILFIRHYPLPACLGMNSCKIGMEWYAREMTKEEKSSNWILNTKSWPE